MSEAAIEETGESDQPDAMATRMRDYRGRYIRSPQTAQRDAVVAEMRSRRMTFQQIAEELGISQSSAHEAYHRVLAQTIAEPAEAARQMELDDLDRAHRAVLEVLERNHVVVSHGRVVRRQIDVECNEDGSMRLSVAGEPIPIYEEILDDGPILQAVDRLMKISESRRKLLGLDAAKKLDLGGSLTYVIEGVDMDAL